MLRVLIFIWPLLALIWCVLALIDALVLIRSDDNPYHRFVKSYYKKCVKIGLTNGPMSRTSFSVTHGFLYVIIVFLVAFFGINQCSPPAKIIKTKYMAISVTSETNDTIDYFWMFLKPNWSSEPDSGYQKFYLKLIPSDDHLSDTAKFCFDVETNFDMKLQSEYHDHVMDSLCTDRRSKFNLVFPKGEQRHQIAFLSDAAILNDPETPYVNLYIDIYHQEKSSPGNLLMPLLTDSTLTDPAFNGFTDMGISIKLGESWETNTYEDKVANADVLPYDLVSIKPEPDNNSPFFLKYTTPEKYLEVVKKGIYISVVNRNLEAEQERTAFLNSVLFGAVISILFTLISALFERWRKVNEKEGKKDPFESE